MILYNIRMFGTSEICGKIAYISNMLNSTGRLQSGIHILSAFSRVLLHTYQKIRQILIEDLLNRVKNSSSKFFERLVVDLLVRVGYGGSIKEAGKAIGKSGDEGIDGIIKEDVLGLDVIYIQAKKWDGFVGRPEIQKFAGALQGQRAKKGIFITTGSFSKEAQEFISKIDTKIVLIDGKELVELMIDHNIGISVVRSVELKKIDSDYFEEPA